MPSEPLYRHSLALLTDLYQLTMACAYWKAGMATTEAAFHLTVRTNPFGGGFAVACGLGPAIDWLRGFRFDDEDLDYLAGLAAPDGARLFEDGFLDHLAALAFRCDVDAVPEGTVVFPTEPLVRVRGPLLQAQLLETALLNLVNFQTLIATKAARVCLAAGGDRVLEFGLRRAQGVDGGLAASRAAYVGGCAATSNVLAGRRFGIPVRGTHAHSWVMAFEDEEQSFRAYAGAMPGNVVLLVDTYDTVAGIRKAIEAGRALREGGHELLGIRLDSGDLLALSRQARRMLDEAGFHRTAIVATGDLDEHRIAALKAAGAPVNVWGVGTRLATGHAESALGGVYKLSAIRDEDGAWRYKVKVSDDPAKSSMPGILQVRRLCGRDVVYDAELGGPREGEDLLVPIFRHGRLVYELPPLDAARARAAAQIAALPVDVKRIEGPAAYPVVVEERLAALRDRLLEEAR
jgi:nicotinate phosphoribosyltransferase